MPPVVLLTGVLALVASEDGRKTLASLALISGAPALAVLGRGVGRGSRRARWAYLGVALALIAALALLLR
jgi:hypothetical protein